MHSMQCLYTDFSNIVINVNYLMKYSISKFSTHRKLFWSDVMVIYLRSDCIKVFHLILDEILICIHLCESLFYKQYFYYAM